MAWCCKRIQERKGKEKVSNTNPEATFLCLTLFPTSLISRPSITVTDNWILFMRSLFNKSINYDSLLFQTFIIAFCSTFKFPQLLELQCTLSIFSPNSTKLVLLNESLKVCVLPKSTCWNSNPQCDDVIWRWSPWKVIRFRWGHFSYWFPTNPFRLTWISGLVAFFDHLSLSITLYIFSQRLWVILIFTLLKTVSGYLLNMLLNNH